MKKKKLYDFSIPTAIIVTLAYIILLVILLYYVFDSEKTNWLGIIFSALLVISYILVVIYYVYFAVTISEEGIRHGQKFIHIRDAKYKIEYNPRFRYDEIIFYNKYIDYKKLDKKAVKKKQIVVQYFPKYEAVLREFFSEENK